jgi:hypothetical protein
MNTTIEAPEGLRTEGQVAEIRKALVEKSPTYRAIIEDPTAVLPSTKDDIPF